MEQCSRAGNRLWRSVCAGRFLRKRGVKNTGLFYDCEWKIQRIQDSGRSLECSGKDKIAFICICIFLYSNIEWLQPNGGGGGGWDDRQCEGFILETLLRRIERNTERSLLWKTDTSMHPYSVPHRWELISWKIKRWDSNKSFVNFYNPQTHWSVRINEDAWYCCRYEQGRCWGQ